MFVSNVDVKMREMTADIRATRAASSRIARVFGEGESVSFDRVTRAFPVRFVECSAGRVDEKLPEPKADALKSVERRIDEVREWIVSL